LSADDFHEFAARVGPAAGMAHAGPMVERSGAGN
jgi:hypothetical protein